MDAEQLVGSLFAPNPQCENSRRSRSEQFHNHFLDLA